jgi:hypothetical protein
VHKELRNYNWIKNLKLINTEVLLEEFLLLFHALNDVSLNEEKGTIFWRWNRSGTYTAASAYDMQFLGAYSTFRASTIWQAKTEPKCRFLAWLEIQGKAPTADNLLKKGWPGNPNCALCYCESETNDHLFTECNFSEAVWDRIVQIFHVHPAAAPFQKGNVQGWLAACGEAGSKQQQLEMAGIVCFSWWHIWKQQLETAGIVCFSWWHIWKERNGRILEHQECSFLQVVQLIREAISHFSRVHQG